MEMGEESLGSWRRLISMASVWRADSSRTRSKMGVVLERDENSWHRGRQGKIRGEDKYMKGTGEFIRKDMGTVKVSFDFSYGKLVVNLLSAHDVAGKKSQDTYANVFLIDEKRDEEHRIVYRWDEKQRVICEYGHQKTQTKNKNLNPVFQEKFVFQTDTNIPKKSLVISIWDEDSSSRDDFMAGITVPLKNVD